MVHRCPCCNPDAYDAGLLLQAKAGTNTYHWEEWEEPLFCTLCGAAFADRDSLNPSRSDSEREDIFDPNKKEPFVSQVRSGTFTEDKETKKVLYDRWANSHELSRKWQQEIFRLATRAEQRRPQSGLGIRPTRDIEEAMRWLTKYDDFLWENAKQGKRPGSQFTSARKIRIPEGKPKE
jgi:hypothetical protein